MILRCVLLTSLSLWGCSLSNDDLGPDVVVTVQPGTDAIVRVPGQPPESGQARDSQDTLESIALDATKVLNENCASCHDEKVRSGNFGSIGNLEEMISSKRYIVPGSAENSEVYKRILTNMPPGKRLDPKSAEVVKKWIDGIKVEKSQELSESEIYKMIATDLKREEHATPAGRAGLRYFTFHVPRNQNLTASSLATYRLGFLKVLNSLSQSPEIIKPRLVDTEQTVYAVKLGDLGISATEFDAVISEHYPFCKGSNFLVNDQVNSDNAKRLGAPCYLIRADWFTATAPLPSIYARLLKHPQSRQGLEERLGFNLNENLASRQIMRSGFKNSGVSSYNRLIERHAQINGRPYWISYDFGTLESKGNLFLNPFGPRELVSQDDSAANQDGLSEKIFEHDGGEVIYQLPNGMLAYYLAKSNGESIDKGPTQIVKQDGAPSQFVSAIVNGISCMNCHSAGLINKDDEVKTDLFALSEQELLELSDREKDILSEIHPDVPVMRAQIEADNTSYFRALEQLGIDRTRPDPVNESFRIYNRNLTKDDIIHEIGIETNLFQQILTTQLFQLVWGSVFRRELYLSREEFQSGLTLLQSLPVFSDIVVPPSRGDYVVGPLCMSKDPLLMNECFLNAEGILKDLRERVSL